MKSLKYSSALLSLAALSACSNEDINITPNNNDNAVKINAVIASVTSSRANTLSDGNVWSDGDQIYVVNTTSNAVQGKDKCAFTRSNSAWSANDEQALVWANNDAENTFQAYFPYQSEVNTTGYDKFTLPADQSTEPNICNSDWMIATVTAKKSDYNKSVNLEFSHQLAKVVLKISYPEGLYTISDFSITDAVVKLPTTVSDARVTTSGDITPYVSGSTITALLPSGKYAKGDDFLTFKVKGSDSYTVKISDNGFSLVGGTSYECAAKIIGGNISIDEVKVNDWIENTLGTGNAYETTDSTTDDGNDTTDDKNNSVDNSATTPTGPLTVNGTEIDMTSLNETAISNSFKSSINESNNYTLKFTGVVPDGKESTFWTALSKAISSSTATTVTIDMSAMGGVTAVPDNEFYDSSYSTTSSSSSSSYKFSKIKSVSLPNSVTSIGINAFYGCNGLTEVKLPGVTSVGESAFQYCILMESVSFKSVTTMGKRVFSACYKLASIELDNLTEIGSNCFVNTAITSLSLPSLETVPGYIFKSASNLKEVYLPKATTFEVNAFSGLGSVDDSTLSLTAQGEFTLKTDNSGSAFSTGGSTAAITSTNINLILNSDKNGGSGSPQANTTNKTWGTHNSNDVQWKSISFEK